ncbi:MAG: hypothetical protein ACOY93_08140 [Bacillota bacterium]
MLMIRPYRRGPSPLPALPRTYLAATTDAGKAIPHGPEPSEWVRGLHRACASWAERLAASWCRTDQRLLTRWLALQAELGHAELELEQARRLEARREAERAAMPDRPDQLNPMAESLSDRGYGLAMAALTLLELPLVLLSFTAFGMAPAFTFLLSLLCAGLTAFLGHAVGTLSRHLRIRAGTMLIILLALSGLFAIALAWLREEALAVVQSESATLDPVTAATALFAISLASLAVASLLAWHHGVDPEERPLQKARAARRRWERRVERLRRRLSQAETGRRAAREMARQDVRSLGEAMLSTFHQYGRWNQLHRDKHDLPPCLLDENLPRLIMPAVLEQPLAWEPRQESP